MQPERELKGIQDRFFYQKINPKPSNQRGTSFAPKMKMGLIQSNELNSYSGYCDCIHINFAWIRNSSCY